MTANAAKVSELIFSDLFLGHPTLADRFCDVPGAQVNPLPAGLALREDLLALTAACQAHRIEGADFKVVHDGMHYRVSQMPAAGGAMFVVRRVAQTLPSLQSLGIPQAYIRRLMLRELSGLILISGPAKSGKTRTAGAIVRNRLELFGGVAVTAENPIELPLEGGHGDGVCFQTALPTHGPQCAEAFRDLMRWGARMILIDEVRDSHAAAELLKASGRGNLIVTTMAGDGVVQSLTRLHALADEKLAPGNARALLADGLLGVLHQDIVRAPNCMPKLESEFLFLNETGPIRNILRSGDYSLLEGDIRRQMANMITESASASRVVHS